MLTRHLLRRLTGLAPHTTGCRSLYGGPLTNPVSFYGMPTPPESDYDNVFLGPFTVVCATVDCNLTTTKTYLKMLQQGKTGNPLEKGTKDLFDLYDQTAKELMLLAQSNGSPEQKRAKLDKILSNIPEEHRLGELNIKPYETQDDEEQSKNSLAA